MQAKKGKRKVNGRTWFIRAMSIFLALLIVGGTLVSLLGVL
jgi:hypothetical protein